VGVTIVLSLGMLAVLHPRLEGLTPLDTDIYVGLLVKELIVGLTMAFFVNVMFEVFTTAGGLIDAARGAQMANTFNPLTKQQNLVTGTFLMQMALALFLTIGGHHLLFWALTDSFALLPPDKIMPDRFVSEPTTGVVIELFNHMFALAFRLAAPVYTIVLVLDTSLGLINKVAQQVQVFFLSMTVKPALGTLIMLAGFAVMFRMIEESFIDALGNLLDWYAMLGGNRPPP
jgi:flagellar biosynthetic protein FliR